MQLFSQLHVPLNLAIVPAWLTRDRWRSMMAFKQATADLWCWHQHGWRHENHEMTGKKQEFGPHRDDAALERDIIKGKQRLENLMGASFYSVFTPPWNRCDDRTLLFLRKHGYVAVSRSQNPNNPILKGLPDFCVNVDLHTRNERTWASGWTNFFEELHKAVSSRLCGIMIHHNRMNAAAFQYLKILLEELKARKVVRLVNFRELARVQNGFRFQVSGVRNK
jgi:hypothetical protein